MSPITRLFSLPPNHTTLITGGSRGIGLMLAKGYYAAGSTVYISSRTASDLNEAVTDIERQDTNEGGAVVAIEGDVGSREGCIDLVNNLKAQLPSPTLSLLINNAGCAWGEPFTRRSGKMNWGWDKVLDLNLKAPFYLTHECLPLLKSGEGVSGRVINIGSVVGMTPQDAPTHAYDASKAALHHLTKKLSEELAKEGITCNAVAPGFVPSKMSAGLGSYASFEDIAKQTPLGRLGDADDMLAACLYLSGRGGEWVTGAILNVDGGAAGGVKIKLGEE